MSDTLFAGVLSLTTGLLGTWFGWLLAQRAEDRKWRREHYRSALIDVRAALENLLRAPQVEIGRDSWGDYLMALGRLEPFATQIGKRDFELLRVAGSRGEFLGRAGQLHDALALVNRLLK